MGKVTRLLDKGVTIPNPECVEIGDEVDIDRIASEGVILHSGCKIFGESTLILHHARIGYQGSATIDNCQIGPEVELHSGYFKESVFLKKSSVQYGAHVREGTILEEQAKGSHTVGLKQTILFPFVTLGSLINFCDIFMAGGTSRKNHSEVGSSYIHFNFTPNQDKATPSLLGDVPRGVMLDQPPIFLGGQGGIVGPSRVEYGTVTAAGTILRRDVLESSQLVFGESRKGGCVPFLSNVYSNIQRVLSNNIIYIANLIALMRWYEHARSMFISKDFPQPLHKGLITKLALGMEERIQRLCSYCSAINGAFESHGEKSMGQILYKEFHEQWPEAENQIRSNCDYQGDLKLRDEFLTLVQGESRTSGEDYISVVKGLDQGMKDLGTKWLQGIVDGVVARTMKQLPSLIQR